MSKEFELYPFQPGQVATLRKTHPCGSSEWVILRVGADVTARCGKCGRLATMRRREFEKAVRSVREAGGSPS